MVGQLKVGLVGVSRRWPLLVFWGFSSSLILLGCSGAGNNSVEPLATGQVGVDRDEAIGILRDNFELLPEQEVCVSEDSSVYAQYAQPTTRYSHGILGDAIEAGQLVVLKDGASYTLTLDDQYVFEDIKPRLFDVDGDGQLEVVVIRTHVQKGAGIMIYKIGKDELREFAWVEAIGKRFRWLNLAAIYDLDRDGTVELAWIQTPHIGGILKVARIQPGKLEVLAESSHYSNHAIGERNLDLSVVTLSGNNPILYVPSQDRSQLVGFQFTSGSIRRTETIALAVDFSQPLAAQHRFANIAAQSVDFCAGP